MSPAARGLSFAALAITIFAVQDGLSKALAAEHPPLLIVMIRYWAFALFVVLMAARRPGGLRAAARSARPVLQILRSTLLAAEVVVAITAFATVGLVATHSIFASAPLVVAALSVPLLGEQVGWRRWTAILVGLFGVLLILKPGAEVFDPRILIAVAAMIAMALYGVLTRLASRSDPSQVSFFYTGVAGAAALTLVGPFYWQPLAPEHWPLMGALCVTGIAGHYFLIRAFEALPAVVVQPFSYLQLVLASMIGIWFFGESPDALTILGAAIIVGAGLFTAWREARRGAGRVAA
ncbi:DMT family transporter [Oceanicella actignis]|uniref:Permease of the drug/metabolite transporter (DMT) superfamily n=1 Tax=Oceanicella actignis TaxID=1189325 RepID=A0A1M7STJ0_9RHOB|nr:DMT family transporter [Oceanicella actignis]SES70128.1 Permease of the drug/metabolite transporter (DMT) superfamily [Oceanicella actignis]SHN61789.1 Permease of the drug/metabolite transporter (DMT) superfamily [Oceanicella actignis]